LEFVQVENFGGYYYRVGIASGEFLNDEPAGGFQALTPGGTVIPDDEGIVLSNLAVTGTPPESVSFDFTSETGESYTVEGSTDLTDGSFSELQTLDGGAGNTTNVSFNPQDSFAVAGEKAFFRVRQN
jgi:hypothetical protein